MLQFKSTADLNQLSPKDPAYPIIKDLVHYLIEAYQPAGRNYDPSSDGWIVLIEESDVDRVLSEIWDDWKLTDIPWEGIMYKDGFYQGIFLANNEFGLVMAWPRASWITPALQKVIDENLDP